MNKLIIAAAGSGKTTFVVSDAIKKAEGGVSVLITTFTEACEKEIASRIIEEHGCIPPNITIVTWFSFLINHGVKPYQGSLFEDDINGMILVEGKSGLRYKSKAGFPVYWGEKDFFKYYFTNDMRIYSDKLAKLVFQCNKAVEGKVVKRISHCFECIYIDEVQDLAGYDLEILDLLFKSSSDVILVGDPRQATYSTANSSKHKKYKKSEIVNFFEDSKLDIETDTSSLIVNYRCCEQICAISNALYPGMSATTSGNTEKTGHDGVFLVSEGYVGEYLEEHRECRIIQLRENVLKEVDDRFDVITFGKSKGLTFDRVVIYPTKPMINWFKDFDSTLGQAPRSKLYVALTRAKYSVAIVLNEKDMGRFNKSDLE
ncbi:UvrD-helicase domain-containing protein [Hahella sp. CR1]|uniref:UvrD-helicase domain-containing protein n=1 Tax=Hahella sp. CR1 TaxID=2992807 RepID=UPI002442D0B2|nr:UvrD-helicase domain-containing protein [Hahella sp. CR1]MDG9667066.1 UvrD-helicase domain-containing protein [Hahella sp. CR1]